MTPHSDLDDDTLVQQTLGGEAEAFGALYDRYSLIGFTGEYFPVPPSAEPFRPRGPAGTPTPLRVSLWLDRHDGTYDVGESLTIGLRVTARAHAVVIELSTEGQVRAWPIQGDGPGGQVEPDRTHAYPPRPRRLLVEGPPGEEDLLLVAASRPLALDFWVALARERAPPAGGGRTRLIERLRDLVVERARRDRIEVAFARAHVTVRSPSAIAPHDSELRDKALV